MKITKKKARILYGIAILLLSGIAVGCFHFKVYEILPFILIIVIVSTISIVNLDNVDKME
ncbi:hypothetical protein Bcop_1649 [Bacteroides coprosuis DSM 18011]|uniref:Lipoprotein n=1 Tax=Bacteroides coprosuis DSM 18011 TaxID=679937 RepID=F3ZQW8_9BACE|nr:hypothetical protein [Bacteroides coprosuis]EGJ71841.1 hypothetical protein Bcop_1649 [Bacteroides coprosuis DSM 18011]